MQLLWKNVSWTIFDVTCSNVFLDLYPKAKETKAKLSEWDLMKHKRFFIVKEIINKMNRQPTERENIIANGMTNKELI